MNLLSNNLNNLNYPVILPHSKINLIVLLNREFKIANVTKKKRLGEGA